MTTSGHRTGEALPDRGHWVVNIRPDPYTESRVARLGELDAALREASVQVRGWDFPHIDTNERIQRGADHIYQESRWRMYLEDWRLYKSGQFVGRTNFIVDWMEDAPFGWRLPDDHNTAAYIGIGEVLYRFVEVFRFAGNLAASKLGGSSTEVRIELRKTMGRSLWVDDPRRWPIYARYSASVDTISLRYSPSNDELIGTPDDLAIGAALDAFELFGWEPGREIMADWIDKLNRI